MNIAERAAEMVATGATVGLGTGRAASAFVRELARRVSQGLTVRAVATSTATAELAGGLGITLVTLEDVQALDLAVDGADEVDPALNLIKGLGGALVREKVVAAVARRLVILVATEKLVPVLGSRGTLPVEVVPFALGFCRRRLEALGYPSVPRARGGQPFVTDNGNSILDCRIGPLREPAALEQEVRAVPGVVATGLFLGMAETVLVQDGPRIREHHAGNAQRD